MATGRQRYLGCILRLASGNHANMLQETEHSGLRHYEL